MSLMGPKSKGLCCPQASDSIIQLQLKSYNLVGELLYSSTSVTFAANFYPPPIRQVPWLVSLLALSDLTLVPCRFLSLRKFLTTLAPLPRSVRISSGDHAS